MNFLFFNKSKKNFKNLLHFSIVNYQKNKTTGNLLNIEKVFEQYLHHHKHDTEIWIKYSIFLYENLHDDVKALESLKKLLKCQPSNIQALFLMSYISFNFLHMEEDFIFDKLIEIDTGNTQVMSLVNYMLAFYYRGHNEKLVKHYFEKSIEYCDGFVWNNYKLGKIYFNEGNIKKAKELTETALRNIQYIYPYPPSKEYSITPVEEFINERLKGIYITQPNLEFMQEQLEEINQKL